MKTLKCEVMKRFVFWMVVLILGWACSTQKGVVKVNTVEGKEMTTDSVEYQMETFDAKFETWYQMQNNPSQYRSQSYYETWNKQYVTAWNQNAHDSRKSWFFETIIGYDPTTDYGFELNHKLFYYFQYVENVLKIKIMPGSPKVVKH